ncbi:MAG: ComEC/Rec2 family competence protein [Clostridia bacterium]|nr:ComEC/Rec2 family competence protein [Clostridia bacterium]
MPGCTVNAAKRPLRAKEFKLPAGRFCVILLLAAVLTGGFRVHLLGFGKPDPALLASLKMKKSLSGFIYKAPWNKEDRLVLVNGAFKALLDTSELDAETAERLARGEFAELNHYYIYEADPPRNPGVFDYRRYLLSRGVKYCVKVFKDGVCFTGIRADNAFPGIIHFAGARIRSDISAMLTRELGADAGVLAGAVMTGETGALDEDLKTSFRNGGVSHLMAVSGMHVLFVLLPVRVLSRNRRTGFRARQLLLIPPLLTFMMIADFSSSVVRATIGALFAAVSAALGRPGDRLNALCLSAAIQLFVNPYVLFGSGFIMSYISVLALIFVAPRVSTLFSRLRYRERPGVKNVRLTDQGALAAGIAVNLCLLPMSARMFGSVSPVGLITTLYASPMAAALCTGGYGLWLLEKLDFLYVLRPAAWLLKYFLKGVCLLITGIAGLGSRIPPPLGHFAVRRPSAALLIIIYGLILVCCTGAGVKVKAVVRALVEKLRTRRLYRVAAALAAVATLLTAVCAYRARPLINALVIDVGQGSSMLVSADGYNGLVDVGSGKTDVARVVRAQGIERLDYIVLTHGHTDHAGGLEGVLEEFSAGRLYVSADTSPSLSAAVREALNAGWEVARVNDGDLVKLGRVSMRFAAAERFFGGASDSDENNASLCVTYSCAYGSLTVAGDLQTEGEDALAAAGRFSDIDVLIAPHHGSASGSGVKMLSLTRPEYAIISVGLKNSYGHPSKEALERLEAAGARVYRTDNGGGTRITIGRRCLFRRERIRIWQTL